MTTPMTLEEWSALAREARRQQWTRWTTEERQQMYVELLAAYTPEFDLPYPSDYNDPSDSPLVLRELAVATDLALGTMITESVANARFLDTAEGNALYSPKSHTHAYAPTSHTHTPSKVGLQMGTWTIGNLNAGVEVAVTLTKPANSAVFVTVQHHSTYIFAVANTLNATQVSLKCRNSTSSTNHTNVKVYYLFVASG